jgi:hypothetical protein
MLNPKHKSTIAFGLAALACVAVLAGLTGRVITVDAAPDRASQGADDLKQPFQNMIVLTLDAAEFNDTISFSVPAGKRLVIEQASATAAMPVGQKVTVSIATMGGGLNGRAWLALTGQGAISGFDRYTTTQSLRMYADAGTAVTFQATRSSSASTATLNFSVTGYLVNTP